MAPTSEPGFASSAAALLNPRAARKEKAQGRKSSPRQPPKPTPATSFDPLMLLNPKAAGKTPYKTDNNQNQLSDKQTSFSNEAQMDGHAPSPGHRLPVKRDHESDSNYGQGSLIEKAFNISDREERPQKKQKRGQVDELEAIEEAKSNGAGVRASGGDLSQYVKEKKQEGLKESGPLPVSIVDLTNGDDDEVMVIAENQEKEVCYGRLEGAKVQAHAVPCPPPRAFFITKDTWPVMKLSLARHPGKDNIIRVIDPTGFDFGNVDLRTSLALARVMDHKNPRFRTQARLMPRRRKATEIPRMEVSEYYDLTINLYGPKKNALAVGRFLSQKQIYLRTPISSDSGIEIHNPQTPTTLAPRVGRNGTTLASHPTSKTSHIVRSTEEIRNEVTGMFDSLERSENMPEKEPDSRIITTLLAHQKQALHFLSDKERSRTSGQVGEEDGSSLWRLKDRPNGTRSYYNVITGHEQRHRPRDVLGGILADMMGLGKTLNMLALMVGSLADAREFGELPSPETDGENVLERNSKATLLVAPLSTLANWEQQIASHIQPKTLSYYVYHGPSRTSDVDELAEYDVVITTYSIVANERHGRSTNRQQGSPLFRTNFFRIVLDEAHAIREQTTLQAQAICALSAERRWAVTGTPVQNRLDDLGGLIKFLRLEPFSSRGGFSQFILAPFKTSDPEILPKLRLLVDSITLRRLKDRINLPKKVDSITRLDFAAHERELYDWFAKDSQNRMKIIASEQKKSLGGRTYAHILRAILRLRLLCAHGRELLSEDDLRIAEGFSAENAIDLEAEDQETTSSLNARQAYEMLMLLKDTSSDMCIRCSRTIEGKDEDGERENLLGYMLPCYHIICPDCMPTLRDGSEQDSLDDKLRCPSCRQLLPPSFFELTKSGMEEAEDARALARENPRQAKIMGRYGGPHTKVKMLLNHLREAADESESLPPEEPPIKSVVFSGWTSNLDLIQIALEDNEIPFRRLDGKMTRKARNASLDAFRDDRAVRVILVSIGAGGLGLNLTSGSRVFMMEPQFNPAAEQQAVDRVHRLGQTRDVYIHRFIMDDSFEVKMLELQKKKQNLADLSMNRGNGKLDKAEAIKKKLEDLRSLFK